jgi:hypothetical protein
MCSETNASKTAGGYLPAQEHVPEQEQEQEQEHGQEEEEETQPIYGWRMFWWYPVW